MVEWRPTASLDAIRQRARLNTLIRDFFAARGVLEVETPILSQAGNTAANIASFTSLFSGHANAGARIRWLRSSPEFQLKRLLAAGLGDCYELGRVFRDAEIGVQHNPEFTMLEWYRLGWDHQRLLDEAVELVNAALACVGREAKLERIAYRDLYRKRLGIDPFLDDQQAMQNALGDIRIDTLGLDRDDWLDLLMTHRMQPEFASDTLLAVYDFPASLCALAKVRGEGTDAVAERFELYLGPLELANGYHELSDPEEQRRRFGRDLDVRRQRGDSQPTLDERLLEALMHGLPACAGVALGVDRLLMAIIDATRIDTALAFGFARA